MKRNGNLVPLSRDHHFGLLYCWKIREGLKKNVEYSRIRKYINYFWHHSLSAHFEIEDIVLPETEHTGLQFQMEQEHAELRKLVSSINQSEDGRLLEDFAKALHSHIRFEERVVFPHLEAHLSEEQMTDIGLQLAEIHTPETENYQDQFWK